MARLVLLLLLLIPALSSRAQTSETLLDWPTITSQNKPWTRWWWHGSSVNAHELTRVMETYRDAGLGGLEITPIYGVAGHEERFIDFLSPAWMGMLAHVLAEGKRLGLGIDMATGTGWPFGGPGVTPSDAAKYVVHRKLTLRGGERLQEPVRYRQAPYLRSIGLRIGPSTEVDATEPSQQSNSTQMPRAPEVPDQIDLSQLVEPLAANPDLQALALEQVRFEKDLPLLALMAYGEEGDVIDLTGRVNERRLLDWTATDGSWTLYALFQGWHGKMVERAAPGGEGYVIDHFSKGSLEGYLRTFDDAFTGHDLTGLRAFFNDSYEVDDAHGEANWSPNLFEAFATRRGYDLRAHLPALFGEDTLEKNARVLSDFRETVSDLLLDEFTGTWRAWAESRGAIVRNQAHGSPANILDLYAASDIPETEGTDLFRIKMASSAANVGGKSLASSESATWLNEHFTSSLADVKSALDRFWLGGVNHVVYHGSAFSPRDEPWPGWLFYAAVHLTPANPLWRGFPALNRYAARIQSFLQRGSSDNDVLLYYPIYDRFGSPGESLLEHFDGSLQPFEGTAFATGAELMQAQGYTFDFISDRQLQKVTFDSGHLRSGGAEYQTLVIPQSRFIPLETFAHAVALAEEGASVVTYGGIPGGVPGLGDLAERSAAFERLVERIEFTHIAEDGVREAQLDEGRFLLGDDLQRLLTYAGTRREPLVEQGLAFVRRQDDSGSIYLVVNQTDSSITDWIPLGAEAQSVALYDPMTARRGLAVSRRGGTGRTEVLVQLQPGESLVVRAFEIEVAGPPFKYYQKIGAPRQLEGSWRIRFLEGGPTLPDEIQTDTLRSWTEFSGDALQAFSGTAAYTLSFSAPGNDRAEAYELDLGSVRESAVVYLNGEELGTLIGPHFRLTISGDALQADNNLEIRVSNAMANRIADLDRRNVRWKKFYNINFPAWLPDNRNDQGLFDASAWQPQPSGLLGPVTLTPATSTLSASE